MIEANKTFPMAVPFQFEGETVTEVTLRRPKGREVRAMQNNAAPGTGGDVSFAMLASLAERSEALFVEMDAADVMKLEAWVDSLLKN